MLKRSSFFPLPYVQSPCSNTMLRNLGHCVSSILQFDFSYLDIYLWNYMLIMLVFLSSNKCQHEDHKDKNTRCRCTRCSLSYDSNTIMKTDTSYILQLHLYILLVGFKCLLWGWLHGLADHTQGKHFSINYILQHPLYSLLVGLKCLLWGRLDGLADHTQGKHFPLKKSKLRGINKEVE